LVLRGGDAQAVGFGTNVCAGRRRCGERDEGFEESGGMELDGEMFGGVFSPEDGGARGVRLKSANEDAGFAGGGGGVRAENGKRVRMLAANDGFDLRGGDAGCAQRRFGNSRMVQSTQCVSPKL